MGIGKQNKEEEEEEDNNEDKKEFSSEKPDSNYDRLRNEILKGMAGGNKGIPMGFNRLNRYIGIRKTMYYLIGGLTGSGKTSFIDDAFILNPVDWYIKNKKTTPIKLKVIYFSMERSRTYKLAKWVARKIFLDTAIEISVSKLLGWTGELTEEELALYDKYKPYMDEMESIVNITDGADNPIGVLNNIKKYALENGKVVQIDKYTKKYIPNDDYLITLIVIDHIGLLKLTKEHNTKKSAIDKMSDELRYARDFYGFSPVVVSQFNRSIANPMRIKAGDVEPQLEDFKESANTQDDADIIMALFDPVRYKVEDPSGYDLEALRDEYGAKFFRSLRLIKNSYGEDDIRVGLAFLGTMGIFKELPRKKDITEADYASVVNKSFFLL
jgi:replicative DNA helicase